MNLPTIYLRLWRNSGTGPGVKTRAGFVLPRPTPASALGSRVHNAGTGVAVNSCKTKRFPVNSIPPTLRADPGNLKRKKEQVEIMPNEDDVKSGANDSAGTKSGNDGDAAGKKAGSDKGNGSGSGDDDGDAGGDKPKPITFASQDELDRVIQKRVDRATKDSEAKAKLSKEQLLEKERDDALALVRERDLKDDFAAAASTAGLTDAGKAPKFFKMYRDDIDLDDKGKPTNLKDVVKALKTDFPELFKPPVRGGGDGGSGNGSDGKAIDGDMNTTLRRMAGRG
jgi:hypothetical protein